MRTDSAAGLPNSVARARDRRGGAEAGRRDCFVPPIWTWPKISGHHRKRTRRCGPDFPGRRRVDEFRRRALSARQSARPPPSRYPGCNGAMDTSDTSDTPEIPDASSASDASDRSDAPDVRAPQYREPHGGCHTPNPSRESPARMPPERIPCPHRESLTMLSPLTMPPPPHPHDKSPTSSLGKGKAGLSYQAVMASSAVDAGRAGCAAPAWRTQAVCGAVVHRSGSGERGRWIPVGRGTAEMLLVDEDQAWSAW